MFYHASTSNRRFAVIPALLASALTLSACAYSSPVYIPDKGDYRVDISQSRTMLLPEPSMNSCAEWQDYYNQSDWPKGDSVATIKEIDSRVRNRFHYRTEKVDTWQVYDDLMLGTAHGEFTGDCDDLSATVSAIAICAGVPKNKLGLAHVSSMGSEEPVDSNHLIAFYKDPTGQAWTFGDTAHGSPKPLHQTMNRIHFWTHLSDLRNWWTSDGRTVMTDPENRFHMASLRQEGDNTTTIIRTASGK